MHIEESKCENWYACITHTCLVQFLFVCYGFIFFILLSLSLSLRLISLIVKFAGHCTNVPRNVNMEKLQHGYLFPEVIFNNISIF
jgi:hypothetical protein